MRRLTRKIGLGGPGALMGVKKPPLRPDKPDEKPISDTASADTAKKSWFARLFGSDEKK